MAPGGSVSLSASAHDPNAGDTVSYTWTAPTGSFANPTQASTTWTAPSMQGPVRLSLTVSDSRGATHTVGLTVTVSAGSGADEVKVDFNTSPVMVKLSSSQSILDVGQQTALSVSASDADGDALSYQWSATCAGSFTGATSASATFAPSALPTASCNNCQLSVVVRDGRGGQNTGSLMLCVSKDVVQRPPPIITRAYQSSLTARASQTLTFEVEANDPDGSVLTFAWAASTGTPGTATSSASISRITWTAPRCINPGPPPSLTATVTNAFGLTVTKSFTVMGVPECPPPESWTATGALVTARQGHTSTLLPNGKVLISGGFSGRTYTNLAAAELYDLSTGTWSPTGAMSTSRSGHRATMLPNGKVLVSGGYNSSSLHLATAELYDPATGTWSPTGAMSTRRSSHTETLLSHGKVLITGGQTVGSAILTTAEVYDPATGTWSPTGSLAKQRTQHTATLLPNGQVLVVGGLDESVSTHATAELYDPATGTFSLTGSMSSPRRIHPATLLPHGKVLVVGGYSDRNTVVAAAELYDPATGTWSPTGSMAATRHSHGATLLPNGKVLVFGGYNSSSPAGATTELYDPATGTFSRTASMTSVRYGYSATLLSTGQVLVSGGFADSATGSMATTELYTPASSP